MSIVLLLCEHCIIIVCVVYEYYSSIVWLPCDDYVVSVLLMCTYCWCIMLLLC